MRSLPNTEWQSLTETKLADELKKVVTELWNNDTARRSLMLDRVSRYESFRYQSVDPLDKRNGESMVTKRGTAICWNLSHSIISSVVSKVAAQQPKVRTVCSDADWATRRRGRKIDQFVEGLWTQRQAQYADIWEMASYMLRDCLVCQVGYIKTDADLSPGVVRNTRPQPWEVLYDPIDARDGNPRHVFLRYPEDIGVLKMRYPGKAAVIDAARTFRLSGFAENEVIAGTTLETFSGVATVSDQLLCYEWYSLPLDDEHPGRHVIAVDGGTILEDVWEAPDFPIAALWYERAQCGMRGIALSDIIETIDEELNDLLGRITKCVRYTSMNILYQRVGASAVASVPDDDCIKIEYEGTDPGLRFETPEPFSQQHLELLRVHEDAAHRYTGVSQALTTAQKPSGVDAGVAIRMVEDKQSERLSQIWTAFTGVFPTVAANSIRAVRAIASGDSESGRQFSVRRAGDQFLNSINWEQVELEEDKFVFQLAKAPTIKGTPADRAQKIEEYFARGLISADAYAAAMSSLDTYQIDEDITRQRQIIDQQMETWLDATPEELESGVLESGRDLFQPPHRWMRLEDALVQVVDGYMQAELDQAPDEILELFTRWIELAHDEIIKKQQRQAAIMAQAGGALPPQQGPAQ